MKQQLFDLSQKVALVTGASSGLGRAMAGALAQAGATVWLAARRSELLEKAAAEIHKQTTDAKVHTIRADLSSMEGVQTLADELLQERQTTSPDILVHAAGVNWRQPCSDVTSESWDQTLDLNLKVPFFLSRSLIGPMRERRWGKIINIASLQSVKAMPNSIPYGASKGGICQLTRAMAEAWSGEGIGVNAIAPGFFPTELTAPVFENDELVKTLAQRTAMGRNGMLQDIHGPVVFLSSAASDYITGQTLFCDGGFTAK